MAGMEQPPDEVLDLLVKELTEGLTPEERLVLVAGAQQANEAYRRGLEHTAAALSVAAASVDPEPLPAPLRERLEREAQGYFASLAATRSVRSVRSGPAGGWWAAAACLLLALFGWMRSPQTVLPPPEPTPAMQRAALLARADTLKIPLGATKDPEATGVTGDIVWDSAAQRGYLRLVGMRRNDPTTQQYQMWIFDGDRDPRYPVDGGVFNVPADGRELVIPIHNVIPVHSLKAFAVTVEKAGGVVVSTRDHVVVLGQVT
jgi:hypothetical protein